MRYTIAALAFAAAANAIPQGVTSAVPPEAPAPDGCKDSMSGSFQITVVNVTTNAKRDLMKRDDVLTLTLAGGTLKDQQGRTGYIASNYQFQFDAPPQAGAIYTSGFSLCGNGSIALGGSAIFHQCYSGGFYNLYDRHWAAQCSPIYIEAIGMGGGSSGVATQAPDGQPGVTTQVTSVSQRTDGQPLATTAPVTVKSDGQPGAPVQQISDGQVQGKTGSPVQQISDGQVQGKTGSPVQQISDGQVQATTKASPVQQISDGQPQAPTGAPVSAKGDGQPTIGSVGSAVSARPDGQPTIASAGSPMSARPDGQPTVHSAAPHVSQKTDGQPVAQGNATAPASPPAQFTGAAAPVRAAGEAIAAIAGIVGAVALL